MWPAAKLLAEFLARNTAIMCGCKAACELGSGLGLTGLLCAQYCNIVLSDHNPRVLKVLQQNVEENSSEFKVR